MLQNLILSGTQQYTGMACQRREGGGDAHILRAPRPTITRSRKPAGQTTMVSSGGKPLNPTEE